MAVREIYWTCNKLVKDVVLSHTLNFYQIEFWACPSAYSSVKEFKFTRPCKTMIVKPFASTFMLINCWQLSFTVHVLTWLLPSDPEIYWIYNKLDKDIILSHILEFHQMVFCACPGAHPSAREFEYQDITPRFHRSIPVNACVPD